jgi:hypothetical protein
MRRFVLGWKMLGLERSLGSRIVTYADDLVILCRRGGEEALARYASSWVAEATVNEEKTRSCKVPEGEFNFLGYTFGRMDSPKTGKAYLWPKSPSGHNQPTPARGHRDCFTAESGLALPLNNSPIEVEF